MANIIHRLRGEDKLITNQQTNQFQPQENYQYSQGSNCPLCGTQLINGMCPNCTNRTNNNPYANIFIDKNEKLISELGNTYVQNYLNNGTIHKGFALLSNKRVYFQGTSYDVVYDGKGRKKINKTNRSRTIDLKDVTGTGYDHTQNIDYLILAVLCWFPIALIYIIFFLA